MELEEEFKKIVMCCTVLPYEKHFEGYIGSFFDWTDININPENGEIVSKYSSSKKKSILNENNNYVNNLNQKRGFFAPFESKLESNYDADKNIITLSDDEEEFLNNGYFNSRVVKDLEYANQAINSFYEKFREQHKYALIQKFKELYNLIFIEEINLYIEKPLIIYENLNSATFKDVILKARLRLKQSIEDKLRLIDPQGYIDNIDSKNFNGGTDDLLRKYIKEENIKDFLRFEFELIKKKFLNKKNEWINTEKQSLVKFHLYCQFRNILKFQYKDGNKFLKDFLEKRYRFDVGDQRKPSKYRKIKNYKGEFYFLD